MSHAPDRFPAHDEADDVQVASGVLRASRIQDPDGTNPKGVHAMMTMKPLIEEVTLVVYGWRSVEPGTLAWVFPSLATALSAAHTMRNAVRWVIVRGRRADSHVDVDEERAHGAVLIEQMG